MSNQATYEAPDMVRLYASSHRLQPAERRVIELLGPKLVDMEMLDIGVGGGRTTIHFASRVKAYEAIDFSAPMIELCRSRFRDRAHQFTVGDARRLAFADASFDFVLFSFNGIDYVDHDDRMRVLAEVRRVLKPGGTFCFSTHNLGNVAEWYAPFDRSRPLSAQRRMPMYLLFRFFNPPRAAIEASDYAVLNDGAYRFRLRTYYVKPEAQIAQLTRSGFEAVRVFGGARGDELATDDARRASTDPWLYYLCRSTAKRAQLAPIDASLLELASALPVTEAEMIRKPRARP